MRNEIMTSPSGADGGGETVDGVVASRLLKLGISSGARPVDDLIAWLERAAGAEWFKSTMARQWLAELGNGGSPVSLEVLIHTKELAKRKLAKPADPEERVEGLLAYFLSIAMAMRHHRVNICGRPEEEVRAVLADLATAVPEPWQHLLARVSLPPVGGPG